MSSFYAHSVIGANLDDCSSRFTATIEATSYARVDFYDRPMFAESPATSRMASNTPNLPQIVAEPVPDVRRRLALTVQVVASRVVRLRLGERTAPDFGILLDPEPAGRCYPAT